jgi:hypothetical protein
MKDTVFALVGAFLGFLVTSIIGGLALIIMEHNKDVMEFRKHCEPNNGVMIYDTENHLLCIKSSSFVDK